MLLQVLCHVDATDGSPSFDLNEVASQNEEQMAAVLQSVSTHLNSLDKQLHAEEADAAFGEVLQVRHAMPSRFIMQTKTYVLLVATHTPHLGLLCMYTGV